MRRRRLQESIGPFGRGARPLPKALVGDRTESFVEAPTGTGVLDHELTEEPCAARGGVGAQTRYRVMRDVRVADRDREAATGERSQARRAVGTMAPESVLSGPVSAKAEGSMRAYVAGACRAKRQGQRR